mmetsp:Transcript_44030/g.60128  ORF Transcript_44030/g.60128 Transcript_44030/m.60128 type:complete len:426 (-) Transcript_44030:273-1550(-)
MVVKAGFQLEAVGRDPLDTPLRPLAVGGEHGGCADEFLLPCLRAHTYLVTADAEVGVLETDPFSWGEAEVVLRVNLTEVGAIDVEGGRQGDGVLGAVYLLRKVWHLKRLPHGLVVRIRQHHLDWLKHSHHPARGRVDLLSEDLLKEAVLDQVLVPRNSDGVTELVQGACRVAPAPEPFDSRHARIIPPVKELGLDQLQQLALGQEHVLDIEPGHLVDHGLEHAEMVQQPVVGLTPGLKLECADGEVHPLEGVLYTVREVVSGIDHPLLSDVWMGAELDPVSHLVEHVKIRTCHVHLHPQAALPLVVFSLLHVSEPLHVYGHLHVPPWRERISTWPFRIFVRQALAAGLGLRPRGLPALLDVLALLEANIAVALSDQPLRKFVQLIEIIGSVSRPHRFPSHPGDVFFDRVDILCAFRFRVRVIIPK